MEERTQPADELLSLLVDDALISRAQAETLAARVRDGWIPLGKILRQQGSITMGQLMDLLQEQASSPHSRLGELAVRLEMCSQADVNRALQTQRETSPHLIDLLAREGHCDPDRLCRSLARYVRRLEERLGTQLPLRT